VAISGYFENGQLDLLFLKVWNCSMYAFCPKKEENTNSSAVFKSQCTDCKLLANQISICEI